MRNGFAGGACLLLCALLWGSTFVAQVFGASYLPPLTYNATRFLLGGAVLLPLVAYRRKTGVSKLYSKRRTLIGGLVCGVALALASYCIQAGMRTVSAGRAGFISTLYILLVPFARLLRGKRAGGWAWVCVAIALTGMFFLCTDPQEGFALQPGDAMVLTSAVFYAAHILAIDVFVADAEPVGLSCAQFLVTGALSGLAALALEQTTPADIWACRWPILYAGILCCGVAYTLQTFGQRNANPMQAALLLSTESLFAAASGWLVLGERFTAREVGGCVLMLAAVLLAQCEAPLRKWRIHICGGEHK